MNKTSLVTKIHGYALAHAFTMATITPLLVLGCLVGYAISVFLHPSLAWALCPLGAMLAYVAGIYLFQRWGWWTTLLDRLHAKVFYCKHGMTVEEYLKSGFGGLGSQRS